MLVAKLSEQKWWVTPAFVVLAQHPALLGRTAPYHQAVVSHMEMKVAGFLGRSCLHSRRALFHVSPNSHRETRPPGMLLAGPGGQGQAIPWLAVWLVWIPGQKEKQKPQELSVTQPETGKLPCLSVLPSPLSAGALTPACQAWSPTPSVLVCASIYPIVKER